MKKQDEVKQEVVQEVVAEVVEVKDEQKQEVVEEVAEQKPEIQESIASLETIRSMIKDAKDLKVVESEAKTGFSFFQGKKRLCKILKTKRGVVLEVNVRLPKNFDSIEGMQSISAALAHKKHLGTMKHLFRSSDSKLVKEIMTAAIEVFRKEVAADKKEETKEAEAK